MNFLELFKEFLNFCIYSLSNLKHSDIDIAIYLKNYDKEEVLNIWKDLEELLKTDIDLVVLNNAKPLIVWEAIRGEKIFVRDYNFYLDYFLKVSSEALDIEEFILEVYNLRKMKK